MILTSRLLLSFVILFAGAAKIGRAPARPAEFLVEVMRISDTRMLRLGLMCLPAVEILVGISLLLRTEFMTPALILMTFLTVCFALLSALAIKRGVTSPCGCFGSTDDTTPLGVRTVILNTALLTAVVYLLLQDLEEMAPIWQEEPVDLILASGMLGLFVAMYALARQVDTVVLSRNSRR